MGLYAITICLLSITPRMISCRMGLYEASLAVAAWRQPLSKGRVATHREEQGNGVYEAWRSITKNPSRGHTVSHPETRGSTLGPRWWNGEGVLQEKGAQPRCSELNLPLPAL
jgi:hypothetical protein